MGDIKGDTRSLDYSSSLQLLGGCRCGPFGVERFSSPFRLHRSLRCKYIQPIGLT